ncbi:MAG: phasin family protein [Candidatus Dormibacteria bacterium]
MADTPRKKRPASQGKSGPRKPDSSRTAGAPRAPRSESTRRTEGFSPRRSDGALPRDRPRTGPTRTARTSYSPNPRSAPFRAAVPPPPQAGGNWLDLVFSLIQAPVGVATARAEQLVADLVRGGQMGQREAERLVRELRSTSEKAQVRASQEADRLDRFVESRIEDVLNRVNIPSRSDIERLNESVDVLASKVEALLSRQERPPRA